MVKWPTVEEPRDHLLPFWLASENRQRLLPPCSPRERKALRELYLPNPGHLASGDAHLPPGTSQERRGRTRTGASEKETLDVCARFRLQATAHSQHHAGATLQLPAPRGPQGCQGCELRRALALGRLAARHGAPPPGTPVTPPPTPSKATRSFLGRAL